MKKIKDSISFHLLLPLSLHKRASAAAEASGNTLTSFFRAAIYSACINAEEACIFDVAARHQSSSRMMTSVTADDGG